ncbi:MAG: VCBS repeat-containing protein [Patescibacteria group bacterium]
MKIFLKNNTRGSALIWTMMLMSLFFITISTVTVLMIAEVKQSTKMDDSSLAYLAAEAGVERIKNYTANNEEVVKTGFMDSSSQVQYNIRVIKGAGTTPADGAKYDSPERYCYDDGDGNSNTNRYCYYSQGTVVGGVTRKIDGEKSDVSSSQAKGINLSGMTGSPPINILSAAGFPICPTCSAYVAPTSINNTFIFKGVVEKSGGGDSNDHVFGLTDNGNSIGIGLKIGTAGLSIVDRQNPGNNLTTPIPVSSLNKIRYTLTYRTGGTTPSVSVMVKDENYKCQGVETAFGYSTKFIPTQIFFGSGATITDGAVFEGSATSTLIGQYNFDDIISFRQSDGAVIAALSDGSTSFGTPTAWHGYFAPTGETPAVGDFNNDGKADIVTFQNQWENAAAYPTLVNVYVALSNGSTGFGASSIWHTNFGRAGETPAVGDFNNDGKADIVTFQNQWENAAAYPTLVNVYVALSNGSTGFGASSIWHTNFGRAGEKTMTGDFNGDNFDDIITFQNNSVAKVFVGLSNGSSNFYGTGSGEWYNGFGYTGQTPMVGDFNGDGKDDIVSFRQSDGKVIVSLNNGSNGFNAATEWAGGFAVSPQVPGVGDFNGDGKDDIVSFRQSDGKVIVGLSNGSNGFNTATEWHSYFSPSPQTPMIGNFNGLEPVYATVNKGINIKGLYFEYR